MNAYNVEKAHIFTWAWELWHRLC